MQGSTIVPEELGLYKQDLHVAEGTAREREIIVINIEVMTETHESAPDVRANTVRLNTHVDLSPHDFSLMFR